jgi:cytochrome c oxidase subunit II
MSRLDRRGALAGMLAAGGTGLLGMLLARPGLAQSTRVIEVEARRFKFTPDEIQLKAGERVVIALRAIDFPHGFSVPDLGLRADLMPGKVVRVEILPRAAGTIDFLCDNFCGDKHEEMHGRFIVSG